MSNFFALFLTAALGQTGSFSGVGTCPSGQFIYELNTDAPPTCAPVVATPGAVGPRGLTGPQGQPGRTGLPGPRGATGATSFDALPKCASGSVLTKGADGGVPFCTNSITNASVAATAGSMSAAALTDMPDCTGDQAITVSGANPFPVCTSTIQNAEAVPMSGVTGWPSCGAGYVLKTVDGGVPSCVNTVASATTATSVALSGVTGWPSCGSGYVLKAVDGGVPSCVNTVGSVALSGVTGWPACPAGQALSSLDGGVPSCVSTVDTSVALSAVTGWPACPAGQALSSLDGGVPSCVTTSTGGSATLLYTTDDTSSTSTSPVTLTALTWSVTATSFYMFHCVITTHGSSADGPRVYTLAVGDEHRAGVLFNYNVTPYTSTSMGTGTAACTSNCPVAEVFVIDGQSWTSSAGTQGIRYSSSAGNFATYVQGGSFCLVWKGS